MNQEKNSNHYSSLLQKFLHFSICLILIFLPLYLLKTKIGWVPFTVLELMIYGAFIGWLIRSIGKVQYFRPSNFLKQLEENSYFYAIFLVFLGVTVSALFSADLQTSAGLWKGWFIAPWLLMVVLLDTIKNQKQIRDILAALTLSGVFVAFIGLWYWFSGDLTYDGRLTAFYLSPNHLAMYLAPILVLSFGLWLFTPTPKILVWGFTPSFTPKILVWGFTKTNWQKLLLLAVSCLLLVVIYLTYSYGAWLGLIAAFIFIFLSLPATSFFFAFRRKGERGKKILLFCFLFTFLLFILIFFQFQTEKAQNLLNFSRSSLESRLMVWRAALEIIKTTPRNFLWGVGPGMFQKYYLDYQPKFQPYLDWAAPQPHNLFLAFWLQTGLVGLVGFIWLLIVFFRGQLGQCQKTSFGGLSIFLSAAMIYILTHGLIDATYWKNDLAIIFWLIIVLGSITTRLSYSQKTDSPLEEREGVD